MKQNYKMICIPTFDCSQNNNWGNNQGGCGCNKHRNRWNSIDFYGSISFRNYNSCGNIGNNFGNFNNYGYDSNYGLNNYGNNSTNYSPCNKFYPEPWNDGCYNNQFPFQN